jgi:glutamate racemase
MVVTRVPGAPIGVFDSGVGGLSVLRAIQFLLPHEHLIYLADQANVPYGSRPLEEVREFSENITRWLLSKGCKLIVVACNTASAAGLHYLRKHYGKVPFVGMEPAVKPAAEQTCTGVVGVLATPATFQGELYASVIERFAQGVIVLQATAPGLVEQIEQGDLDSRKTRQIIEHALSPMLAKKIDTVVLGCTHFPFVIPLIQEAVGPQVRVIDPSPAIARQTEHLLNQHHLRYYGTELAWTRYVTTGNSEVFRGQILTLLGDEYAEVEKIEWGAKRVSMKRKENE